MFLLMFLSMIMDAVVS